MSRHTAFLTSFFYVTFIFLCFYLWFLSCIFIDLPSEKLCCLSSGRLFSFHFLDNLDAATGGGGIVTLFLEELYQIITFSPFSQYLENYLWVNYTPEVSSKAYLMSICCIVNEKFRENVPAWEVREK